MKIKVSITVPDDTLDKLKVIADKEHRSLSGLISVVLEKYIKDYK